jgi:hypothetical protein
MGRATVGAQASSQAAREAKINDVGSNALRSWCYRRTRIRRSKAAMLTLRDETAFAVTKSHKFNGQNRL